MSLPLVVAAIVLLCVSGALTALAMRWSQAALAVGSAGAVLASAMGGVGSVLALFDGTTAEYVSAWPLPLGTLRVGIDPLSAFFLLCVFAVSGLAAVYSLGYLRKFAGQRRVAAPVALMNALVASMAAVVIARDAVVFLAAWEAMSMASFFLVLFDGQRPETRRAALVYLIASHLGALPIFASMLLVARSAGGLDFAAMTTTSVSPWLATPCFLLALLGFGAKAGFWPLHVWLPEAHPAAPSPVSAVMSGVMIKMGIYGLLRMVLFLGAPPAWWGILVIGIGAVSGVAGVLHALVQHDLKRLLAYHSVENIGIIALGVGIGLLGQAQGQSTVAFLGYAGALLHVLNHGLFKGLLFEGAGSVQHAAGTRDIDSLGGLSRRMPTTSLTFLIGSVAISGLPPLNGFVSELLIYVGAFQAAVLLPAAYAGWALCVVPVLALIGGLAATCFVKAFGIVFLGEPRTQAAARANESGPSMRAAMAMGAALCVGLGVFPQAGLALVRAVGKQCAGIASPPIAVVDLLAGVTRGAFALVGVVVLLLVVRWGLLRGREVRSALTWGCGYEAPTSRMQYSAESFADPMIGPFLGVFRSRSRPGSPHGYFPAPVTHEQHLDDRADGVLRWVARACVQALAWPLRMDRGGTRRYLVYVLATLVALLVWQLTVRD
jgi:hydrogenase-4 component B